MTNVDVESVRVPLRSQIGGRGQRQWWNLQRAWWSRAGRGRRNVESRHGWWCSKHPDDIHTQILLIGKLYFPRMHYYDNTHPPMTQHATGINSHHPSAIFYGQQDFVNLVWAHGLVWVGEGSRNIWQMGHHVRGRKLFPPTVRISILNVLGRVRYSTAHVCKGKKGKKTESEGSRWIVHRG